MNNYSVWLSKQKQIIDGKPISLYSDILGQDLTIEESKEIVTNNQSPHYDLHIYEKIDDNTYQKFI